MNIFDLTSVNSASVVAITLRRMARCDMGRSPTNLSFSSSFFRDVQLIRRKELKTTRTAVLGVFHGCLSDKASVDRYQCIDRRPNSFCAFSIDCPLILNVSAFRKS